MTCATLVVDATSLVEKARLDWDLRAFGRMGTYGEIVTVCLRLAASASTGAGAVGSRKAPSCTVADIFFQVQWSPITAS